jgi:divalent metal cation (Fe/Co/Zn/Cd) transporter
MEHTDEETTKKILVILEDYVHRKAILGYHHLRHRLVYQTLYVEMHLYLVPSLSLREAHDRASLLEMAIQQAFGDLQVVITSHLEPQSDSPHPKGYHEPVHDPLPLGEAWTPPPDEGASEK